jgi:hypothetical protein
MADDGDRLAREPRRLRRGRAGRGTGTSVGNPRCPSTRVCRSAPPRVASSSTGRCRALPCADRLARLGTQSLPGVGGRPTLPGQRAAAAGAQPVTGRRRARVGGRDARGAAAEVASRRPRPHQSEPNPPAERPGALGLQRSSGAIRGRSTGQVSGAHSTGPEPALRAASPSAFSIPHSAFSFCIRHFAFCIDLIRPSWSPACTAPAQEELHAES